MNLMDNTISPEELKEKMLASKAFIIVTLSHDDQLSVYPTQMPDELLLAMLVGAAQAWGDHLTQLNFLNRLVVDTPIQ
jgi:hypothetical protein